ncbi:hypothetical protein [Parvularcula dongshanensis]|uniref:Lipoprotein n=1 Tax=Parvularcula dongshanensis TaxID=1173995 RepID=A0A840HY99_9PROT|nr:hypothetical protein [Parvularcula dongshanensis]MBB4657549.1 hypothetical protein [Parvularcula dongshanensis]
MKARLAIASFGAFSLCSCASVTVSLPGLGGGEVADAAPVQERIALTEALAALDASVPPEPTANEALGLIVFGGHDRARKAAAEAYLQGVTAPDPLPAVFADIDEALRRARAVAEAGQAAATALVPVMDDVALLEDAIGDVRRCATLYTDALGLIRDKQDEAVRLSKTEIRAVKDAFTDAARDISASADRVAARLSDVPERLALPSMGTASAGF